MRRAAGPIEQRLPHTPIRADLLAATGVTWGLNVLLAMIALRFCLRHVDAAWSARVNRALAPLVDPIPKAIESRIVAWRGRPPPTWLTWAGLILGIIVIQQLLVAFVLAVT